MHCREACQWPMKSIHVTERSVASYSRSGAGSAMDRSKDGALILYVSRAASKMVVLSDYNKPKAKP